MSLLFLTSLKRLLLGRGNLEYIRILTTPTCNSLSKHNVEGVDLAEPRQLSASCYHSCLRQLRKFLSSSTFLEAAKKMHTIPVTIIQTPLTLSCNILTMNKPLYNLAVTKLIFLEVLSSSHSASTEH